jgi:multiple antibiotic resistance protein
MDLKALVTLLAIVNPLACIPFFIHYTQGFDSRLRRKTIRVASFTAFCVIALSALLGLKILEFFGITLASFQVGGGMLLLMSALSMLNAQPAEAKSAEQDKPPEPQDSQFNSQLGALRPAMLSDVHAEAPDAAQDATADLPPESQLYAARTSIAVVPLTIPLLTGPATMSTVVIYAEKAKSFTGLLTLVGYGVVIALATFACLSLAQPIARLLGKTGINVMTRLMGLILAALAVEVMTDGLIKLFPVLGRV